MTIKVVVGCYSDFYSEWWGLQDGTILPTNDERGRYWQKYGDVKAKEKRPPWLENDEPRDILKKT